MGEVRRGFPVRLIDHYGRDDNSDLHEHAEKAGNENVNMDHFEILSNGYSP